MKMKKLHKTTHFFKKGFLLFTISFLLWNCEKETLDFNQPDNLVLEISNQFNSEDFKKLLPHQFLVNWSNPEKQFSEALNTYFYEFPIVYVNELFNPVTINKISPRKYYHKYKIIVLEKENGNYVFYLAKFFQEKDEQNTSLLTSEVTFNQNTGYKGLVHLYDKEGQQFFGKYIYENESSIAESKNTFDKKEKIKMTVSRSGNQPCVTIYTAHYRDWYQHVYDAYGNYLGAVFLYSEFIGYTSRVECDSYVEPAYVNGRKICQGSCVDVSAVTEAAFCPNGDPIDATNGNCDGYGEDVSPNNTPTAAQLLQIQQDYIIRQLSIMDGSQQMDWVSNNINSEGIEQVYNYLQMYDVVSTIPPNIIDSLNSLISILSSPLLSSSSSVVNYTTEIQRMVTHLREFGNPEDEFFADYIDSLIPDFTSMTVGDVYDIYKLTRTQVHSLVEKYLYAVVVPFAEAAFPFVIYALTEATLGVALPLLSRIPLAMVLRGERLNKMVRQLSRLGTAGTGSHIRLIPNSTYAKSLTLFNKITQNAISVTTETLSGGRIRKVANMGEGNYITFRNFDFSDTPGLVANIDLNFPAIWSKIRELKFIN